MCVLFTFHHFNKQKLIPQQFLSEGSVACPTHSEENRAIVSHNVYVWNTLGEGNNDNVILE